MDVFGLISPAMRRTSAHPEHVPVPTTATKPASRCVAFLFLLLANVACGGDDADDPGDPAEARAAAAVVEQFGGRLVYVSLLAPGAQLQESIRAQYEPYVTNLLMSAWLTDPYSAPGREASSPWPDRVEVSGARRIRRGEYEVRGDVVYVTSIGEEGLLREPVAAVVVQGQDDAWRITEWREL